jgi:hypothetical protein
LLAIAGQFLLLISKAMQWLFSLKSGVITNLYIGLESGSTGTRSAALHADSLVS